VLRPLRVEQSIRSDRPPPFPRCRGGQIVDFLPYDEATRLVRDAAQTKCDNDPRDCDAAIDLNV